MRLCQLYINLSLPEFEDFTSGMLCDKLQKDKEQVCARDALANNVLLTLSVAACVKYCAGWFYIALLLTKSFA